MAIWDFQVRWEKSTEIKQDWIKVKRTKILCSISDTRSSGTYINGKLGFAIKIA